MSTTQEQVIQCVREVMNLGDHTEINMETNFSEDLAADSLDLIDICMAVEDKFGCEMLNGLLISEFQTPADYVKHLEKQQ